MGISSPQSHVEEILERIKVQPGVEGYVICNHEGQVLRRFPTMTQETAELYADRMKHLVTKVRELDWTVPCAVDVYFVQKLTDWRMQARCAVRDLNPKQELKYLRIRAKRHEVMVAYDRDFLAIVIQRWQPHNSAPP
jgi:dynein light chain roadblock-type